MTNFKQLNFSAKNIAILLSILILIFYPAISLNLFYLVLQYYVIFAIAYLGTRTRSIYVYLFFFGFNLYDVCNQLMRFKLYIDSNLKKLKSKLNLSNKGLIKLNYILIALLVLKFFPIGILFILFIILLVVSLMIDVDEKTFHLGLNRIFYKLEDKNYVRLNLNLPLDSGKVAYETKSTLFKKLYEFGNIKPSSGVFEPIMSFQMRGLRIIQGIYSAITQPTRKISVGISKINGKSNFFIEVPSEKESEMRNYLSSLYPGIAITVSETKMNNCIKGHVAGDWRKRIKTEKDNTADPFQFIINRLEMVTEDIELKYELIPLHSHYNRIINRTFERLAKNETIGGSALNSDEAMYQNVGAGELFAFEIIISGDSHQANLEFSKVFNNVKYQRGNYITFSPKTNTESVISTEELYTLWHLEVNLSRADITHNSVFPYPPEFINKKFYCEIGESNSVEFQNEKVGYETIKDMCHHTRILGTTGQGKSNLLRKITSSAFRDPTLSGFVLEYSMKGTTASDLHNYLPAERLKDVIYLDPTKFDIPMNMIDVNIDKETAYKDMAFIHYLNSKEYSQEGAYMGRLDGNLQTIIKIISATKTPTSYNVAEFIANILSDPKPLNQLQENDDINIRLWATSLAGLSKAQKILHLSSAVNNILRYVTSQRIINNCSADDTKLSFVEAIKNNKIVIINLSNLSGTEKFSFGIFYAYKIHQAIKSLKTDNSDTHCLFILEEAQNILEAMGQEIKENLSETRGLKTGYIIAHQYTAQINDKINVDIDNLTHNKIFTGSLTKDEIEDAYNSLGLDEETDKDKLRLMPVGNGIARSRIGKSATKPYSFQVEEIEKLNKIPLSQIITKTKKEYSIKQQPKLKMKAIINNISNDKKFVKAEI